MKIPEILEKINKFSIVPVASFSSLNDALAISDNLIKKDLPIIEITFRTGNAPEYIKTIKKEFSKMLVGAGSVVSVKMAKDAINSGADFIVMPGLNDDILKLFPAEISGGVKYLKAVSAPFPSVKFIPTGGINPTNYQDYLEQKNVLAVGGSWPIDEITSSKI